MDHHTSSLIHVAPSTTASNCNSPSSKLNLVSKMGSNNEMHAHVDSALDVAAGNCNGTQRGVIVSANSNGKQGELHASATTMNMSEDDEFYPQQNSSSNATVVTPANPSSSLLHSSTTTGANSKEVAQVMSALNGHAKNCCSMDQNAAGRNVIRPEPRSALLAEGTEPHPQNILQHLHHIPQQPLHHFPNPYPHQSSVSGGTTMGRLVVESEYYTDPHPQTFRRPETMGLPPTLAQSHSMPVDPESSSPPSYGDQGGKTFGRKRSRKRPKTCGVCGDRAKSFHFGGLSCDSCKAFFRRSVQNDAHVAFRCAYDSCCDINISTRKSCQYCRFKKCLSIGMEKSWVMTEEERNHLNQQRLEKKQSKPTQQQTQAPSTASSAVPSSTATQCVGGGIVSSVPSPEEPKYTFQGSTAAEAGASKEPAALAFQESEYVADVEKMLEYMTYDEQNEIKSVVETYLHAYKEMPFRVSFEEGRRDTLEIIEMFTTILRRFAYFAKLNKDFGTLSKNDQGNLLRAAVLEMCLLRGAACFDTENNRWPSSTMESLKDCPQLRVEDMKRLVSRELFEMHITFILHMKRLRVDEPIAMLLIMTVLFSPERTPVENKHKINQAQEKYLMLLKKYVSWKFGQTAGSRIYPQLLTKLSDLRQLNDFHTEFHLNLDRKEVNAIKKSLMELSLNPYPNWKIVPESRQSSPEESRATSPVLPAPSPFVEAGSAPSPMVTQALIRSFTDRRIPALLENPYATFETDMGMIRQVQQTLGSLFPTAGLSPAFTSNTQPVPQHPSTEPEAASTRNFPYHDQVLSLDRSISGGPSSISPRGYSSSTDSAEAQAAQALEFLQSSRQSEYQPPPIRSSTGEGASTTTSSFSSYLQNPLSSMLPTEYHSERLQRFLQRDIGSDLETASVIRSVAGSSSSSQSSSVLSGSQTVLRKHSSSGPSLPAAPSSVIRSAPARASAEHTSMQPPRGPGTILFQEDSPSRSIATSTIVREGEGSSQPFRPIASSTSSTGWHGGEVHTTANGERQAAEAASAIPASGRFHQHRSPNYDDDDDD